MLAGDLTAAERELRLAYAACEEIGDTSFLATIAGRLGQVRYAQGSYDDAATLAEASKKNAVPEDRDAQILWRSLKAMTLARRGDFPSAEQLAREAVALCESTDFQALHGEALMDLGEVLRLEGRTEEATEAVEEALRLFDEKGALASAVRAHELLRKLARA